MSRAINTITAATAADGATNLNIDSGTLFIDTTNNNVGIGTTSPATKLDVSGTIAASGAGSAGVNMLATGTGGIDYRIASTDNTNGLGGGKFTIYDQTAGSSRVLINSSGNVGIGTTSPGTKLHVSGAGTTSASYTNGDAVGQTLYLQDTGNLAGNGGQILFGASQGVFAGIKSSIVSGTGPAGNLIFQTRDTTGNVLDRMTVTREGLVGIGVTSPISSLHLKHATPTSKIILEDTSTNRVGQIGGGSDGAGGLLTFSVGNNGGTITEYLRIDSSGNVLVGTPNSLGKLTSESSGSGLSTSPLSTNSISGAGTRYAAAFFYSGTKVGHIEVTGSATSLITSSDYRLKTNVEPIINGIERVKQLPVYSFNWKIDESGNKVDGFLAHEAKSIVPECVSGEKDAVDVDGNPIYQGIDQSKIVPLLTAALKDAIAKIETLESKVTALEAV